MMSNIFYDNFKEMFEKNYPKKALEEDGVAATTTAAIPTKIAITPKMQKEYTDENSKMEDIGNISSIVPNITPSSMTSGATPIKKKSFLECLEDALNKRT